MLCIALLVFRRSTYYDRHVYCSAFIANTQGVRLSRLQARSVIKSVMDLRPEEAELVGASREVVKVELVDIGSLLAVRPGAKVPIDGVVTRGDSHVDEGSLTGKQPPPRPPPGRPCSVWCGTRALVR